MDEWLQVNDMRLGHESVYRVSSFNVDWHWDCVMACQKEKSFNCKAAEINRETDPDKCYLLGSNRYEPYTTLSDSQNWTYYERHAGK